MSLSEGASYQFGPFEINSGERQLRRSGEVVALPPKAVDTLLALIIHRGRILSKEELGKLVWPDTIIELENALARNVSQLRKALGECADYIETLPKRGYGFTGPVEEKRRGKTAERSGLAVLPLKMLSAEPGQEPFCEGMNEALITNLAKISALRVYQAGPDELAELAAAGRVETAVEGAYFLAGRRVRITVRLIRARTREHLWAESYESDLRDVVELQGLVARDVAKEVRVRMTPQEQQQLSRTQPVNPEAYQVYLEGRFWWNQRTVESLSRAIDCFQLAVAKDPGEARAYSGLADAHALLGSTPYNARPPKELFPKAAEFARKALELDPELAEARTSLAYVKLAFDWDAAGAEREFRQAIGLNPGYATARHWYGHTLLAMGRLEEAMQEFMRARELDPRSPVIASSIAWCHYNARRYDRAIEEYRKILERDPNYVLVISSLGWVYARASRMKDAIDTLEHAVKLAPNAPAVLGALGYAHALAGDASAARGAIRRLQALCAKQYIPAMLFALVHAGLKETEAAAEWLEKAREERSDYINYLSVDPAFAELSSRARGPS